MGTTALRQLLKSLCNNSVWNYAVFWKLCHGSPIVLTWEDGYFSHSKPRELVETIPDDVYCKGASDILAPQFGRTASGGISEDYPVGHVVADMLRLQYVFGEGVVGVVAAAGSNHCWVSINHIFTGEVKLIPKCPEEWLLQFASGIKTILLVPVLPHGVLQLGSLKEVAEDINMVAHIKCRFNCLHSSVGENPAPFSLKKELEERFSPLISSSIECFNAPLISAFASVKTEDLDQSLASNIVELDNYNLASASYIQPLTVQDALMPTGDMPEDFIYDIENKIDISLAEVLSPSESINASQLEMVESKLFELSCLMGELQGYSDCNDYNVEVLGESFNGVMNFHSASSVAGKPCRDNYAIGIDDKTVRTSLRFPKDSELHEVLEPDFNKQRNGKLWDLSFMVDNFSSRSSLPSSKDPSEGTDTSWFARGGDAGYLLEAVVANACSSSEDVISNKFNSFRSSTSFSGNGSHSPKLQKQHKATALVRNDSMTQSHLTSACITEDKNANCTSDTLRSMMITVSSKEEKEKESDFTDLRRGQRTLNTNKRRARLGDNQRPRPRDRQLIQDRVKELRELVPNGAKCSIDGLLDRTIKHMMYLRSVTDHAEKLRQCMHQEVAGCKNFRPSDCQNGTSWAYELGSEFQLCPIVVEDLAYPGHMLIEMLCNEHGLFLEIAQVIRGLELTILKGALESRSNNTWARFVVEAFKGFHRLDIFWPLMQLLQRKRNSISSKI